MNKFEGNFGNQALSPEEKVKQETEQKIDMLVSELGSAELQVRIKAKLKLRGELTEQEINNIPQPDIDEIVERRKKDIGRLFPGFNYAEAINQRLSPLQKIIFDRARGVVNAREDYHRQLNKTVGRGY